MLGMGTRQINLWYPERGGKGSGYVDGKGDSAIGRSLLGVGQRNEETPHHQAKAWDLKSGSGDFSGGGAPQQVHYTRPEMFIPKRRTCYDRPLMGTPMEV